MSKSKRCLNWHAYLTESRNRYLGTVLYQENAPNGVNITCVKVGPNKHEVQAYTTQSLVLLPPHERMM